MFKANRDKYSKKQSRRGEETSTNDVPSVIYHAKTMGKVVGVQNEEKTAGTWSRRAREMREGSKGKG